MRTVLLIINPASSRADEDSAELLKDIFSHYDYEVTLRVTDAEGDAKMWAQDAQSEGFAAVAIVGGDGTIMEVVSGLLGAEMCLPIYILPAGTGNLLAHALHIPEDPAEALEAALERGQKVTLDVGYIKNKDRYFMVAAGAGLDAETMQDTGKEEKEKFGRRAYVRAILSNLFMRRTHDVTIQLDEDDSKTVRVRAHSVMVFNASKVEVGLFRLGPGVTPHDGEFDIAVLRGVNAWSFLVDAWHLLFHQLRNRNAPDRYGAKHVKIDANPPLLTQADGDVLGETPLEMVLLSDAVEIFVPQDYVEVMEEADEQV
jgi:YegS/Rv2252/BmrU family lipid kinase